MSETKQPAKFANAFDRVLLWVKPIFGGRRFGCFIEETAEFHGVSRTEVIDMLQHFDAQLPSSAEDAEYFDVLYLLAEGEESRAAFKRLWWYPRDNEVRLEKSFLRSKCVNALKAIGVPADVEVGFWKELMQPLCLARAQACQAQQHVDDLIESSKRRVFWTIERQQGERARVQEVVHLRRGLHCGGHDAKRSEVHSLLTVLNLDSRARELPKCAEYTVSIQTASKPDSKAPEKPSPDALVFEVRINDTVMKSALEALGMKVGALSSVQAQIDAAVQRTCAAEDAVNAVRASTAATKPGTVPVTTTNAGGATVATTNAGSATVATATTIAGSTTAAGGPTVAAGSSNTTEKKSAAN